MLRQLLARFAPPPVPRLTVVPLPSRQALLLSLWILRRQLPQIIAGAAADCSVGTARDLLLVLPGMIREASEEVNAAAFAEQAARDEEGGWER